VLDPKLPEGEHIIASCATLVKGNILVVLSQTGHIYLITTASMGKIVYAKKMRSHQHFIGICSTNNIICLYDANGLLEIFSI
jgi:hypothetical protein